MSPSTSTRSLALALALVGCDALDPTEFQGISRIEIPGNASPSPPGQAPFGDPIAVRLGVFWNPQAPAPFSSFDELIEQPSIGKASLLPGPLEWSITEEPRPEHLATTRGGRKFALARLLAYEDANANARRDAGEKVLAQASVVALYFSSVDLPAEDSPTGVAIPRGFHLLGLPLTCEPREVPAHDGECGVKLGEACASDAACGPGGRCLSGPPAPGSFPFPGGYCTLQETPQTTCRPKDGVLWTHHRDPSLRFWMKPCTTDDECRPDAGRYQCDYSRGACMPTRDGSMFAPATGVVPTPYCRP